MAGIVTIDEDETDVNVLHSQDITIAIRDNIDALYRALPLVNLGGWYLDNVTTTYDCDGSVLILAATFSYVVFTMPSFWVPAGVGVINIDIAGDVSIAGLPYYYLFRLTNLSTGDVYESGRVYNADFVARLGSTRQFYNYDSPIEGGANYRFEAIGHVDGGPSATFTFYGLTIRPLWS